MLKLGVFFSSSSVTIQAGMRDPIKKCGKQWMKVGLLGSSFHSKQLLFTLYLILVMEERCYLYKMLRAGRKILMWAWRPLRSVGRHQTGFSWLLALSLKAGWDLGKKNNSVLGIGFQTRNIITNFLSHWPLHCIRGCFSHARTNPSMRENFLGDTWALWRQEVEQSVTNNESEMPAFERALLSLHREL